MLAFFASPLAKYGAIAAGALAIAFGVWWILDGEYDKGEKAGKAVVTDAVKTETIKKTNDAVKAKDKADDEVGRTPYRDLINDL
jgi:hypothetical protein